MLPADRKIFRLVRKLLWEAEVQRRLPAALRRRKERAVAEDGAEGGGLEEEADAAPTGRVPGLRGAFIIASTPCSCVGVGWGPTYSRSGIVRLFEVV